MNEIIQSREVLYPKLETIRREELNNQGWELLDEEKLYGGIDLTPYKNYALDMVALKQTNDRCDLKWLADHIKYASHIEDIVSTARHLGSDIMASILVMLSNLHPNLRWHRGGTLQFFMHTQTPSSLTYFPANIYELPVIDGGTNGLFGRPNIAFGFTELTKRVMPVLYTTTPLAIAKGVLSGCLRPVSEHRYDLLLLGDDTQKEQYALWCKDNLDIKRVVH